LRKFKYVEPDEDDQVKEVILTEEDIMAEYWEFWSRKMAEKFGEDHELITQQNCLEDWLVSHWAFEVKE
jgi:hypothetical protein